MSRDDVSSYYKETDFFLSPSIEEGFPYSLDEAAYCEVPIVASKCPGQSENKVPEIYWIEDPSLYDRNTNVKTLESTILKAIDSIDSINVTNAKSYVINNFNINKWAAQVISVYYDVLNN